MFHPLDRGGAKFFKKRSKRGWAWNFLREGVGYGQKGVRRILSDEAALFYLLPRIKIEKK